MKSLLLSPAIVLAKKNGDKIGQLDAKSIEISDLLNNASEIAFSVYKYNDGKKCELWDEVINFRLIHCVEWDMWFEITVEIDEEEDTVKTVFGTSLGHAELSQIMLYDIEINTEDDIARDDYEVPTVLYNPDKPEASLLHRIMEKAKHYTVIHVDSNIANIQRTFTFDNTSIYDAFLDISEEINCLFVLHSNSDSNGGIARTISVYDLESKCLPCDYRGEFTRVCPECGETALITEGYGEDTNIFITSDELANNIQLTTDTGSIKNCFKLEGGDDLMTATIRHCNPNGTDYIWYFSDDAKIDMSKELVAKIESYDKLYEDYQKNYVSNLDATSVSKYNALVTKYRVYNSDLESIKTPIVGYPALMNAYYNTIDLALFLESTLMPTVQTSSTTAKMQAARLTTSALSPVAATSITNISLATADSIILFMARIIISSKYRVKVADSSLNKSGTYPVWTGNFDITNYSDEEDTATSATISVVINDDYSSYVQQKIKRVLKDNDTEKLDITGLFAKPYDDFVLELKKYSLNCLKSFHGACQSCIDILIEQGIADKNTWSGGNPNLYDDLYVPYINKLSALESEMNVRQDELDSIVGVYDKDGNLEEYGLQNYIEKIRSDIQEVLDFEKYLGNDLSIEFASFRREDKFSNSNYISDGLNNAEIFNRAIEFINIAQKEIFKSAELQHSITTTLKNLLTIKKFESLVESFQVGNWIRVMIDEEVYKLRLIEYSINYDKLDTISVKFSDVVESSSTVKSIQDVLKQANSMATSYDTVQRQAQQGEKSNDVLNNWADKGLDATNTMIIGGADNQTQTWDEHGMLFRKYDYFTDSYDDIQLKIINSTLAVTDDNWKTVKTAVGAYYYFDPETGKLTMSYGINAETLVGKLILGERLGIYNAGGSLKFDLDGLTISNGINTFNVNPNSDILLSISKYDDKMFYVDENGILHVAGVVTTTEGSVGAITLSSTGIYSYNPNYSASYAGWYRPNTITTSSTCFFAGATNNGGANATFKVTYGGKLTATGAEIDGKITTVSSDGIEKTVMDSGRSWYYEDGVRIGHIGSNGWVDDDTWKGLVFCSETDADYMAWCYRENKYDSNYTVQLVYYTGIKDCACGEEHLKGFNFHDTTYFHHPLYLKSDGLVSSGALYFSDSSCRIRGNSAQLLIAAGNGVVRILSGGGAEFECEKDRFIFHNSDALIVDCYNNIDMHNYSILNQSDVRLKTNIADTKINALEILSQIELKEFDWIENNKHENIGIIAQQLQEIIPDLIYEDKNTGKLSIKIEKFIPYLIKSTQELYELISGNNVKNKRVKKSWNDDYDFAYKENFIKNLIPVRFNDEEIDDKIQNQKNKIKKPIIKM